MTAQDENRNSGRTVGIWDRPTRMFHWVLVVLFVVCYFSGDQGRFDIHIPAGQALMILIVARIAWGFFGSQTARFRSFVRPVSEIVSHIRSMKDRRPGHHGGHNPLGGLSVVLMLVVLVVHTVAGLFAADVDGLHEGPLSFAVSYGAARDASAIHGFTVNVMLALVALHVAAIIFHHVYKRENLIGPMITGRGRIGPGCDAPGFIADGRAVIILIISAIVVLGTIELAGRFL